MLNLYITYFQVTSGLIHFPIVWSIQIPSSARWENKKKSLLTSHNVYSKQRENSEDEERSARSDQTSQSFNESKLNGYILTSKYKVSHACWRRVLRKTNGTKLSHHFAIVSNQIRRSVDLDDLLSDTLMLLRKKSLSTAASIECTSQNVSSYSNGKNIE